MKLTSALFWILSLLFSISSESNGLTVQTPNDSSLVLSDGNGYLNDVLRELNVVLHIPLTLEVTPNEDYDDSTYLQATCKTSELCVAVKTSKSSSDVQKAENLFSLSAAALVIRDSGTFHPLDAYYFLRVFYSSVWSLLLLCALIVLGMLFVSEYVNPFGYGLEVYWGTVKDRLTLFQCIVFVVSTMFMHGYSKAPKSVSGRILGGFWWAFCTLMYVLYVAGTVVMLLTNPWVTDASVNYVPTSRLRQLELTTFCRDNSLMCNLYKDASYKNDLGQFLQQRLLVWNYTGVATKSDALLQFQNHSMLLVCDSLFAARQEAYRNNFLYWPLTAELASIVLVAPGNATLQTTINRAVLSIRENGRLEAVSRKWLSVDSKREASAGMEFLLLLRSCLPVRSAAMFGPLVLLIIGAVFTFCSLGCEYFYRTFIEKQHLRNTFEEVKTEEEDEMLQTVIDPITRQKKVSFVLQGAPPDIVNEETKL